MIAPSLVFLVLTLFAAGLFLIGWRADRAGARQEPAHFSGLRYGLSLGTLFSAWSYFGAAGDAAHGSWLFLANALGPVVALTLGYPLWRRMAVLARQENVGSLADFLAVRYGKSRMLGMICACIVAAGALPYLALQIDIVTRAWAFATGPSTAMDAVDVMPVLLVTGIAILFGARHPGQNRRARGFVSILAVESCVKMVALCGVAVLAARLIAARPEAVDHAVATMLPATMGLPFAVLTLLYAVTTFVLPRQFHLGFVTLERVEDARAARWIVPIYFAISTAASLTIGLALHMGLGMAGVAPGLQMLALPLAHGQQGLALLSLVGGLSAGTAMVAVETTAISAMIANELVLPVFARFSGRLSPAEIARSILHARWGTILMVGLLAWIYYDAVRDVASPVRLGVTALSAFAQFVPALLGGLYWRRGHAHGAVAGLLTGITVWAAGIAAPILWPDAPGSGGLSSALWPEGSWPQIEFAMAISLAANTLLYVFVSLQTLQRPIDMIQARSFLGDVPDSEPRGDQPVQATLGDVLALLTQFLGAQEAEKAVFDIKAGMRSDKPGRDAPITLTHSRMVEKILAGVIGAPAARNVVSIAISRDQQSPRDFDRLLDEAAHAAHFSRELLQIALESLPQGIGVMDEDLRLIAWNTSFLRLMKVPLSNVHVGKPLSEVFAGGSEMADAPAGDPLQGSALMAGAKRRHVLDQEWLLEDGRVLQVQGKPLDQGDYMAILSDITERKAAERVLAQDNEALEARVASRTRELSQVNAALADATQVAQRASNAQKRFVAAASHDLVQPLHAARLFVANAVSALDDRPEIAAMLERADQAVDAAHGLLKALLNLSRLETGVLEPALAPVDAGAMLDSLADEFMPQARARGLTLIVKPTAQWVRSDRDLLRSMLQNLMLNALRYTPHGRVLVALRQAGEHVRFEVRDTGVGILPDKVEAAFGEYSRLSEGRFMAEGAGLGLSIVARIGQVLGHPITVRSRPGEGSVFAITLPRAAAAPVLARPIRVATALRDLRVLCIDDERDILLGTRALIERWGGVVTAASSVEQVPDHAQGWDAILADHHLPGETGLSFLRRMEGRASLRLLVTATPEEGWEEQLGAEGIALLRKPIPPLSLHALLSGLG